VHRRLRAGQTIKYSHRRHVGNWRNEKLPCVHPSRVAEERNLPDGVLGTLLATHVFETSGQDCHCVLSGQRTARELPFTRGLSIRPRMPTPW
jgi:hypothetical protein